MLIGIDLGTTNSLVACIRDGKPEVLPNRLGKLLTPSVISIDEEDTILVGETAREYGLLHPLRSASVFKRSMGTDKEYVLGNRKLRAEELSGLLLKALKEDAEAYLGESVEEAIISVPAYFNDKQRTATKKAGELAGLKVARIINEPTAAALCCGAGQSDEDETCLVFDLGGGTFDVSILEFSDNIIEVHAVAGDNFLGGEDFTNVVERMFLRKAKLEQETLSMEDAVRLQKAAESCKCSYLNENTPVMKVNIGGNTLEYEMPVSEYKDACKELLDKLRKPIERSIRDAGIRLSDIDRLVLVGGATRLPLIRNFASSLFRRLPAINTDPDLSIALGAAITCGMKERQKEFKEIVLTDICPFTLGTEVSRYNGYFDEADHYLPIIERNTVIPVSRTQTVYTANDNQNAVTVRILQGESRKASQNLLLGELHVPVPPGPKGKEAIDITYTYDVNSILEVQVHVLSTALKRKAIIRSADNTMTDEELEARFEELSYLKRAPKDEEENRLLVLRGERLYEETLDMDRARIDLALTAFQQALNRQDPTQIKETREELKAVLDSIENMF